MLLQLSGRCHKHPVCFGSIHRNTNTSYVSPYYEGKDMLAAFDEMEREGEADSGSKKGNNLISRHL
jgi:hypothetical protein